MRIVLVRHGETEWNREEIFRGRADVPLNDRGRSQAAAAASALKTTRLAAAFAGPLSRALETGKAIAAPHGLECVVDAAFNDLDFGAWQGLPREEVKQRFPEAYELWKTSPHKVRFPGGETLGDVTGRAMAGIARLAAIHAEQTVLVATHRVVCKVILCAALGLDNSRFWQIQQDTCCINRLRLGRDGIYIVETMNDTCHLAVIAPDGQARDF